MGDKIEDTPFHFDEATAEALGRPAAGSGRLGPQPGMEPTPGRVPGVQDVERLDAAAAPDGELQELPRGWKTDGVTLYVPPKPGILIGNLMIDASGGTPVAPTLGTGSVLALNVVDPRGCAWRDRESNAVVRQLVDDFLAGGEKWLEFRNPVEGHTFVVSRYALERLLAVCTARMEIKEPPVPEQTAGGIPIVREVGPMTPEMRRELRRATGL